MRLLTAILLLCSAGMPGLCVRAFGQAELPSAPSGAQPPQKTASPQQQVASAPQESSQPAAAPAKPDAAPPAGSSENQQTGPPQTSEPSSGTSAPDDQSVATIRHTVNEV